MRRAKLAHPLRIRTRLLSHATLALLAFSSAFCPGPTYANLAVGGSAGDFLGFEIGASSAGIAGANTSVASGTTSQYWNPSLLASMTRPQASMMHATWLGDLQYEWIGYAKPLGPRAGTAAASVSYFHMPSLNGVDQFDNPTGEFRVYDMALTVGYARSIVKGIQLGANGKLIRQTLASVSGTGAAVDLGASATLVGTTFGATVQNIGPDISFGNGSYPLPGLTRFGLSRPFLGDRLLLAADYTFPKTYYNDIRFGAEVRPNAILAVRAGYRRIGGSGPEDPGTGLSFGLGAHYGPINLDYAMTPDNGFADVHRLSFGYTFGGSEAKPETKPEPKKPPVTPPAPKQPPVIVKAPAPPKTEPATRTESSAPPKALAAAPTPEAAPAPSAPEPQPIPKSVPTRDQYEVVLGNYQSEASAQSELKALQILGFSVKNATVSHVPGSGYRLALAPLNSKKSADELAASLSKLSFTPHVEIARR